MNNQAKIKLEKIKKLKLPEKVRATADKIEKGLSSADAATQKKAEDALNKLYDQIKAVAAKQREEKTEKEVNEKTIVPQNADISAPEAKKELTKKTSQFDEAIDKALKNDPELANFGKSDKRRDAGRKALPAGRRVAQKGWANQFGKSDGGRVYYENRENRKDRKSPAYKQGYPFLAKGGKIHPMDDEDGTFYVNFYKTKGGNIVSVDEREYKSKASAMTYAMMKRDFMTVDESIFVMNDDGDVLYTSIGTKKMAMGGKFPYQNAQVGDNARVILDNKMGTIMVTYGRRFHLKFPDGTEKTYSAEELEFFPTDEMMADGGVIGNGKNGYVAFYKGKRVDVNADSMYGAQKIAAKHFNAKKEYEVNVMLAELDGKQYYQSTVFAKGGYMTYQGMISDDALKDILKTDFPELNYQINYNKINGQEIYGQEDVVTKIQKHLYDEYDIKSTYSGDKIGLPYLRVSNQIIDKFAKGGYMAKGGQVGDDVLKLKKGDVFKIIDKEHTATNEDFVFIDYVDYRNQIALEVIPLRLIVKQKFTKGDFKYLFDISSDGIKLLDEKELSAEFKKHIYNFLIKIGQKLPYNMNYAKGGYMAEGENYEYVNTFKRYDSNVPVPQDDFEKLVDAYHKQLSGDKLAVSKYKVLKLQMGNYLGHKTVEEMVEYIEKTHNAHKMAKGGVLKNATYVSKRNINDIKVEINKSIKDLKGADLLDGIYVKNNALKAKFDAYKSYEELSELNGKIWDKLKIESGSQIYASDSLQKKMAIEYQNMGLDAKFKKLTAAQRKKVAEIMTDENEHSLRNYLTLRGYLGQKEYDSYSRLYEPKRPYVLNPANYKKEMASGGSIGFEGLSKKVAARYEGKNVKAKFQKQYGKTYDKAEAKEVGDKVAGKVYFLQQRKMADGGKMQGFDDRLDESLADRNNKISKMNATFKARRNESKGENKSLGKRAYSSVSTMDKMASGGKIELPHQLDKYFTKPAGTIEVEMSKLIPIRARKSGIENAEMYMKKAYDGEMAKRKPIEIFKTRNKKYRVNDGNSTYAVAKKNGWETIYAIVVSNPNVTKRAEKSTFTIAKEIRKEGESWADAVKRVKENRK